MDRDDIIDLLTIVQAGDNRTVGQPDILIWHEILERCDKDDCTDAIMAHRREQPGVWLEPGHVAQRVRMMRNDRIERADPDDRPHLVGLNGAKRRDNYGFMTKAADDDYYPDDWTAEQRLAASWDAIKQRRDAAAMMTNSDLPASALVRSEAMQHIRSVLHR